MTNATILNLFRLLFLSLSLACAATAAVWRYYPEFVDRVDGRIVRHHLHECVRDEERAGELLRKGRTQDAIAAYQAMARSLRGAQVGDRRFPYRKRAIAASARLLARSGDTASALTWADELHQVDPRDMVNNLERCHLLKAEGREEEGRALLLEAAFVAGGDPGLQQSLATRLIEFGETTVAAEILIAHGDEGLFSDDPGVWQAFLPRPDGNMAPIANPEITLLQDSGKVSVRCVLPEPVTALKMGRIDLPAFSSTSISSVEMRVIRENGPSTSVEAGADARTNELQRTDDGWVASNARDAFLFVEAGIDASEGSPITEVIFEIGVRSTLSSELARPLRDSNWSDHRDHFIERFGEERVALFEGWIRG